MPMQEDLTTFFNVADFADQASLDGAPVVGIFDGPYTEALGMASAEARFTLPSASVGATTSASTLVLRGITYRVRGAPQHDGTGACTLQLERLA